MSHAIEYKATPTTFVFTDFDNVISVTWTNGAGVNPDGPPGNGSPTHQFDNIIAAPIPEPSSIALLGMGGLTLFGYGWRRRRKTELST